MHLKVGRCLAAQGAGSTADLLMGRADESSETHQLALALGYVPVAPPMATRIQPWEWNRALTRGKKSTFQEQSQDSVYAG